MGSPKSMGRPTKPIALSEEDRVKLQEWARRPKSAQRLALRARIVLGCADGMENRQVARQLRIADQTVCKWRERFRSGGLDGLADEPRPGTPRKITDGQVEALITRTLETVPAQGTHWSTRTMAEVPVYRNRLSPGSGVLSLYSRTASKHSSCPPIRSLWRRCATSSVCI